MSDDRPDPDVLLAQVNAQESPPQDAFDRWAADRNRREDQSVAARYVPREVVGYQQLDAHGQWSQDATHGPVWIPQGTPANWAPYRQGHWEWISPWGWTWIDAAPWGFAPFHYGRWVSYRDRWCWVPGTYVRRPVYAPALVGWVGGPQVNVSISIGSPGPAVGWFPLAPREVYVPTYRVSPRYVQQVNITHVTNITNITTIVNNPQQAVVNVDYRNRHLPHAVTVVPQTVFVNRQPVMPAAVQVQRTPVMQQALLAAQKAVVAAPPVPQPAVDEVRRRHGFAPEGGARPGVAAGARTPATVSNIAPTGAGVNIPPPPTHVVAPAARQADGEARARFERRRDDGRGQPVAPNAAATANPAAVQAQGARPTPPATVAPAAQPARAMSPLEAAHQEAARQQEARQQDAQRAEQQRQQDARRQQDVQRQQEAQRAQEAQRQQAEVQRQQLEAQQRQQRGEQQRQEAVRRQQEAAAQQQRAQEAQRAAAQREQEARVARERGAVPPPPHAQQQQQQQREAVRPQPEQAQGQRPAVSPAQAPRPAEAQEKPRAEPKGKEERAERGERERGQDRRPREDNNNR